MLAVSKEPNKGAAQIMFQRMEITALFMEHN